MPQKQIHIKEVLTVLEMPLDSWKLNEQGSPEAAIAFLSIFKKKAKNQHHVLVKKYHPDLPKNGVEEETKLKKINAMIDVIMKLKITIREHQPRSQVVRFHVFRASGGFTRSSTSSDFYSF